MKQTELLSALESLIFVAGDNGITYEQLAEVIEQDLHVVKEVVAKLKQHCQESERGLTIVEIGGSIRFQTKPEHSSYIKKLATASLHASLSQAALETLAIVAYKQPITRVEVDEIRGVKSDRALSSLASKLLIKEVGRQTGPGRPILYGTTTQFLDHFGLTELSELPPLPEDLIEEPLEEEVDLFFREVDEDRQ